MKALKESIFSIVRRRENIKMLSARPVLSLPLFLIENNPKNNYLNQPPQISQNHLDEDLKKLLVKKQVHLSLPDKKVGKKMNRFSFIGLIVGLFFIGCLFFITGFIFCYSIYPPYGGVNFSNNDIVSKIRSSPSDRLSSKTEIHDSFLSNSQSSEKSYADRQKLLKRTETPSQLNLLDQAEQKTLSHFKYQFTSTFMNAIQTFSNKIRQTFDPFLSYLISPLIDNFPQQLSQGKEINNNVKINPPVPKNNQVNLKDTLVLKTKIEKDDLINDLYSLRLQRFQFKDEALSFAQKIKEKGFDSYVVPFWTEKSVIYEVRSGSYSSFQQARQAVIILKQVGIDLATIVMTNQSEERMKS